MKINARPRKKTKLLNIKTTVLQSNYINLHLLLESAKKIFRLVDSLTSIFLFFTFDFYGFL